MTQKPQIKVGQKISAKRLTENDVQTYLGLDDQPSRNIIVGVPAAFAPNCDAHPPGYIDNYEEFQARGISDIFIVAVNDAFVMSAWKKYLAPRGTDIHFIADADGSFVSDLGLMYDDIPLRSMRAKRFVILMDDAEVQYIAVEDDPCDISCTGADALLAYLDGQGEAYARSAGVACALR
ncbi:thioredoxin-like protein [Athelia psychrophila]|uniref:Thioredoxin-like protein n=1 Tax=Athelia psychrophila TaxID=1759441 RepID=A0A167TAQ3_9AGAM|nr:thioredoxin-like protein [Fibularhizoctonia sp. CBS 109695]